MVFSSTIFLFVFLPCTLVGYYLLDRRFKNIFLLVASLLFYAWGEPRFVLIMIFSTLVNYCFGLLVVWRKEQLYQRLVLTLMVAFNLSLFFVFKYLDFTIVNLNKLLGTALPEANIALPIGISFFTFQAMSYVFDVYRGKGTVQKNPVNVLLYVSFFPQLIAGPIVRYETVANEIRNRKETLEDFANGIQRFAIGLGKKAILANSVAVVADRAFGYTDFSQLSVLMAWLGVIAYALQIYFDFSGYSDMAIGLGLMFGFHFNENFNYPYIAKTIPEFWQRWHISLGAWFRDYMFYPISVSKWSMSISKFARNHWGRNAGKTIPAIIALSAVWFCTGLWHGASWGYVIWGCYYGILLILSLIFSPKIKKLTEQLKINTKAKWFTVFQVVRTLLLVLIADVFFRAYGAKNALKYLGCMFGLMENSGIDELSLFLLNDFLAIFLVATMASTPILTYLSKKVMGRNLSPLKRICCVGLFILSLAYVVNTAYDPFIYFNF